jgi:hypothetical protein
MARFYVTFGQQYAREEHPAWPGVHPDGWVTIEAPDYDAARERAFTLFGRRWAFLYEAADFDRSYFPGGELARIGPDDELPGGAS